MFARHFLHFLTLGLFLGLFQEAAAQEASFVAEDASPQQVSGEWGFPEGPAADLQGNVYFSDITNNKIYFWDASSNRVSLFRDDFELPNGLILDAQGRLVVCEMGRKQLVRIEPDGEITLLANSYEGKPINMPNDLWIDSTGGIYFSDFAGGPSGGGNNEALQVYYVSAAGAISRVTEGLTAPNGLIGTPDGKRLYVTDPGAGKTWFYEILGPGQLGEQQLFVDKFADGMALDEQNNLYFSGESVTLYSPDAAVLDVIEIPGGATNLTFAGADGKTLFVTGRGGVYTLQMNLQGAKTPLQLAQ